MSAAAASCSPAWAPCGAPATGWRPGLGVCACGGCRGALLQVAARLRGVRIDRAPCATARSPLLLGQVIVLVLPPLGQLCFFTHGTLSSHAPRTRRPPPASLRRPSPWAAAGSVSNAARKIAQKPSGVLGITEPVRRPRKSRRVRSCDPGASRRVGGPRRRHGAVRTLPSFRPAH